MSNLVTAENEKQVWTANRECDSRTALLRALVEYIRPLRFAIDNTRDFEFRDVLEGVAEPEDIAMYPAACVFAPEPGSYQSELGPNAPGIAESRKLDDNTAVVFSTTLQQRVVVNVWCSNPTERNRAVQMLEDAFWPVDWMGGFKLRMPHYCGAFSMFDPVSVEYEDAEPDVARRYRKATLTLTGECPVIKVVRYGVLTVRREFDVGTDVDVGAGG